MRLIATDAAPPTIIFWAGMIAIAPLLMLQQATPAPEELRYLAIESEIALQADDQTAQYQLTVEPQRGGIALSGEVGDEDTRTLSDRIVRAACRDYPIEIVNKIRVKTEEGRPGTTEKPTPTPLDKEQMEKLRELLEGEFPELADKISLGFEVQPMPRIMLEGLISNYEQKLAVSRFVRRAYQTLPVVNNLQVRRERVGESSVYVINPKEPRTVIVEKEAAVTVEPRRPRPTDAELAENVADILRAEPVLQGATIKVTVDDGVAWLAGHVASRGQMIRATRLAEECPGIRYVVAQLAIAPSERVSDSYVRLPDQQDEVFFGRRTLNRRFPALAGSTINIVDTLIEITPATERPFAQAEIAAIETRLKRIPELKHYMFRVRPRVSIIGGKR
jgi:osmotically-inducible protein OsmY